MKRLVHVAKGRPRLRPHAVVKREVADYGSQGIGTCGAVDIAVGCDRDLQRAAGRFASIQRTGIEADQSFNVSRKAACLSVAQLALCRADIPKRRIHPCEFEPDPCCARPFVEHGAKLDRGITEAV